MNKESDLLEQCVGVDPLTWNLHKPYSVIEENDEAVENLYQNIMNSMERQYEKDGSVSYNGHYEVEYMCPKTLKKVPFYQTRDTEYIPS